MSKLGNVNNLYGKKFSLVCANTTGSNILSMHNLPQSSLILTAMPDVDKDDEDTGIFSLVCTDYEGNPIRLTYTLQEGSGLFTDDEYKDVIKVKIDNDSIIENENNELLFDINAVIDNRTIIVKNNKYQVNINALDKADEKTKGTVKIDNSTVKLDNNKRLYIETGNLSVTNGADFGVIQGDGNTINIDSDGTINVVTNNLQKASKTQYGVSLPDGSTIISNNGTLSVITENLRHSNDRELGISKPDNITITLDKQNNYKVNTQNLKYADNKNYGVIKADNKSITITDGVISMNNYSSINKDSYDMRNKIEMLDTKITTLKKILMKNI